MTVSSTNNKVTFVGDGANTTFPFTFPGVAANDIQVYYTDTSGNISLISSASYGITLNAASGANPTGIGGTITYPLVGSPIALGTFLTILRTLPITQTTSLANQGALYQPVVEASLDQVIMILQQLNELLGRQITVAISDSTPTALPPAAQRANLLMGFDSSGNPIATAVLPAGTVSSAMQPVVNAATLAAGRAAFGLGTASTVDYNYGLQAGVSAANKLDVNFTTTQVSTNQSIAAANHLTKYIATGPVIFTLPRANTLWNGFGFWIHVVSGGLVTIAIDSHDTIEGLSSGTSATLYIGQWAYITTDAAASGNWRIDVSYVSAGAFFGGKPWFDVKAFGATGDGVTDDAIKLQAAFTAAGVAGGCVFIPAGRYKVTTGLTVPTQVRVIGADREVTIIDGSLTDVATVTTQGSASLENLTIFGKGIGGDTGSFGATKAALTLAGGNTYYRDLRVWGGSPAIFITSVDSYFMGIDAGNCYGSYNILNRGSGWFIRNKFDHAPASQAITTAQPYPAWAALTAYVAGNTRIITNGGNVYACVCTVGGTSGAAAPTLKNYGINIVDATVTWQLVAQSIFIGMQMETTALENRFVQTDFTGSGYTSAVASQVNTNAMNFSECVFNSAIDIVKCQYCYISQCTLGGTITSYTGNTGAVNISDNWYSGTGNITVQANVDNFSIKGNYMGGGTITVAAGTSNHYTITGNFNTNISDGGTGVAKSVTGNVA